MNSPGPSDDRSFPLVGLFLVLSLAGIASGIVATTVSALESHRLEELVIKASASGIAWGVLGAIISVFNGYRGVEILACSSAAFAMGMVSTCLVWLPPEQLGKAILTTTLGCGVMVIAALLGRRKPTSKNGF